MRICVVTSYGAAAEPRAPRHAVAAKRAFPKADVILVDLAAASQGQRPDPSILGHHEIARRTIEFPTRFSDPVRLGIRKLRTCVSRLAFKASGVILEGLFGAQTQGLTNILDSIGADVYVAHNIETLQPAAMAACRHRAALVFDCMEFYSDMGDGQSQVEAKAARQLEARWLPACELVLASSEILADALCADYGIKRPFASYNVPAKVTNLPPKRGDGLNLYWRNSVIGFGQRGLEDIFHAMTRLPAEVRLYLQGRPPVGGTDAITDRAESLGLRGRVTILEPYAPEEAVQRAAPYEIGLCLERKGPRNHDLTVSNKMFDYHMAGLAVISSDLPSLAGVIERSGGGLVYKAGDVGSLTKAVQRLNASAAELKTFQRNARRFAMGEANLENELGRITVSFRNTLAGRVSVNT